MATVATDDQRASECFTTLLVLAAERDLNITRTKVAKLLYLADLRSVEHSGVAGSGVAWRWMDHGPFDKHLLSIEDTLVQEGIIEREITPAYPNEGMRNDLYALSQSSTLIEESDEFVAHIEAVLDEYGSWTATNLIAHAYQTPPMQEAQENDDRDGLLDLDETAFVPDIRELKAKARRLVEHAESISYGDEDDPPVSKDTSFLVDEIREWSHLRKKATSRIL